MSASASARVSGTGSAPSARAIVANCRKNASCSATGLAGRPLEASFLAFALGLLLSGVGALTVGIAGRRPLLAVAGVGALVALLAPGDPWHDLALLVFCVDWAADGALRLRDRVAVGA